MWLSSHDLFFFKNYGAKDILYRNFRLFLENDMVVMQILYTDLASMAPISTSHYVEKFVHKILTHDRFSLFLFNRDGCHMWGRKYSLFPEDQISLALERS